jgi:hypothetical protein
MVCITYSPPCAIRLTAQGGNTEPSEGFPAFPMSPRRIGEGVETEGFRSEDYASLLLRMLTQDSPAPKAPNIMDSLWLPHIGRVDRRAEFKLAPVTGFSLPISRIRSGCLRCT